MKHFFAVLITFFGIGVFSVQAAECWKIVSVKDEISVAKEIYFKFDRAGKPFIYGLINGASTTIFTNNLLAVELTGNENKYMTGILELTSGTKGSYKVYQDENLYFVTEFGKSSLSIKNVKYIGRCQASSLNKRNSNLPKKTDSVLMKNGDVLSGLILTAEFILKSSYADLTIKTADIRRIQLEGGGQNIEIIELRSGDRISGLIKNEHIEIKLPIGPALALEKDKIKLITFKK